MAPRESTPKKQRVEDTNLLSPKTSAFALKCFDKIENQGPWTLILILDSHSDNW